MTTRKTTRNTEPNDANIIFHEDFNSIDIDRNKWNFRITGKIKNNEQQAYINSKETVYTVLQDGAPDNNILVIHPRYQPGYKTSEGNIFDFSSGWIDTRTKFEFTYGLVSARIKLPAGSGLWPAFWLLGTERWPDCGEIDIMENVGEAAWTSSAIHGPGYSGDSGLANIAYFPQNTDATDWHVYSVKWSADQLQFMVDDMITYRVTRPMVDYFGDWVFNSPKFLVINLAIGGTYPFKTNGIKSPYYGLGEETVQQIKVEKANLFVDWVTVKQG